MVLSDGSEARPPDNKAVKGRRGTGLPSNIERKFAALLLGSFATSDASALPPIQGGGIRGELEVSRKGRRIPMDLNRAIQFGQLVEAAYAPDPGDLANRAGQVIQAGLISTT